jgi:predicted nucleotidyltransferase component of viral defense system
MIPRAHITAWRKIAPWPADALVEQDLVLSRVLVELYAEDLVAEQLAFRGGTALHKLFFNPSARFSEDIDLVQVASGPIGPAMNTIHDRLDGWLGKPSTKQGQGRATLHYRFDSEIEPAGRRRLKIEVNTREHFSVLGLQRRPFTVSSPWFQGDTVVTSYLLEELLGTKLRALYQRKKGRDLFDLAHALAKPEVDADRIVECFERYMEDSGGRVSRAQFEANLAAKASDAVFREDVTPLLSSEVAWDIDAALRVVSEGLVAKLPGEPWKGGQVTS